MRMMEILWGLICPSIIFVGCLFVLFLMGNALSPSAMGAAGGFLMVAVVWVTSWVLIKLEKNKARKHELKVSA